MQVNMRPEWLVPGMRHECKAMCAVKVGPTEGQECLGGRLLAHSLCGPQFAQLRNDPENPFFV